MKYDWFKISPMILPTIPSTCYIILIAQENIQSEETDLDFLKTFIIFLLALFFLHIYLSTNLPLDRGKNKWKSNTTVHSMFAQLTIYSLDILFNYSLVIKIIRKQINYSPKINFLDFMIFFHINLVKEKYLQKKSTLI